MRDVAWNNWPHDLILFVVYGMWNCSGPWSHCIHDRDLFFDRPCQSKNSNYWYLLHVLGYWSLSRWIWLALQVVAFSGLRSKAGLTRVTSLTVRFNWFQSFILYFSVALLVHMSAPQSQQKKVLLPFLGCGRYKPYMYPSRTEKWVCFVFISYIPSLPSFLSLHLPCFISF